jgi:hypothetical protein
MHRSIQPPLGPKTLSSNPALLALLFWLGSYTLLSLRAMLNPEPGHFALSMSRLLATGLGAIVCGWVITRIESREERIDVASIFVGLAFAAVLTVLVRQAYSVLAADDETMAESVRWTLVWAGYSATFVAAYCAFTADRRRRATIVRRAIPEQARHAVVPVRPIATDRPAEDELAWVVDALAEAIADSPRPTAQAVIARLTRDAGYLLAQEDDALDRRHNRRVQLVQALAARLDRQKGN